jgi:hypothetical protein
MHGGPALYRHFRSVTTHWDPARNRDHERSSSRHTSGELLRVDPSMRQRITRSPTVFGQRATGVIIGRSTWADTERLLRRGLGLLSALIECP